MTGREYPQILSDREVHEWIRGCPIRIKRIRLIRCDDEVAKIEVTSVPCGEFGAISYTADIEYMNEKRETIVIEKGVALECGKFLLTATGGMRVVCATVTVMSVSRAGDAIWVNETGERGIKLPEMQVLWQTDPMYKQIKRECAGVTEARYIPDCIDGAWRCTCGGVNLDSSRECGECGCSHEWIIAHFDREYLEAENAKYSADSEKTEKRRKKRGTNGISAGIKAIFALSAATLLILLTVLTVAVFIPQTRYAEAIKLAGNGDFDRAIEIFTALGDYADAAKLAEETVYKKAQTMTGFEKVLTADSTVAPWFSITADGVLSFDKEIYAGSWEMLVIPDVFDGIVVSELSRNCFMNCDKLTGVRLSSCIRVIGEQAFYNCTALSEIDFGGGVRVIMPRAFINCTSLEYVELPDSVESVGARAFNNCISLRKVVLGAGVRLIAGYQFSNCTALERLTLLSPLERVEEYAFVDCDNLEKLYCRFPESEWSEPIIEEGNEAFTNIERLFDQ